MKYILISLLQILSLFFAQALFAQQTFQCLSKNDLRSTTCKMSYDLLGRVVVAKQRGELPTSISAKEMEGSLRSGRLELPANFEGLSDSEKRKHLFRQMSKEKNVPTLDNPGNSGFKTMLYESGTRGGGLELPEDLWIWF